jgi:hypothetical protein
MLLHDAVNQERYMKVVDKRMSGSLQMLGYSRRLGVVMESSRHEPLLEDI